MCKFGLRDEGNMGAAYVDKAADMAKTLVQRESRGPGDTDNAMRRVERKYGVSYSTLWALRYRRPNDILMGAFLRLMDAYEAQRQEQLNRLQHERSITEAKGRFASYLVSAADALGRSEDK